MRFAVFILLLWTMLMHGASPADSAVFLVFTRADAGLVHFAVLGDHIHLVVEADSKRALSRGMQKLTMSMSRRLNALSVRRHAGNLRPRGALSVRPGWVGKVFGQRYHARRLRTPTETRNAIAYVLFNADRHFGSRQGGPAVPDPYSSAAYFEGFFELAAFSHPQAPRQRAVGPPSDEASDPADVPVATPRGWLLRRGWRRTLGIAPPARSRVHGTRAST